MKVPMGLSALAVVALAAAVVVLATTAPASETEGLRTDARPAPAQAAGPWRDPPQYRVEAAALQPPAHPLDAAQLAAGSEGGSGLLDAAAKLARSDPGSVMRWIDAQSADDSDAIADALFGLAAGVSHAEFRRYAQQRRPALGWLYLETAAQAAPTDELAVTAHWLTYLGQDGHNTQRAVLALAQRYALADPQGALAWALDAPLSDEVRLAVLTEVASGAMPQQPIDTLHRIGTFVDRLGAEHPASMARLAQRAISGMRAAGADAVQLLSGVPPGPWREALTAQLTGP